MTNTVNRKNYIPGLNSRGLPTNDNPSPPVTSERGKRRNKKKGAK